MDWSRREWLMTCFTAAAACVGGADGSQSSKGRLFMKTFPLGRHLIDLPEGFQQLAGSTVELYFGLTPDALHVTWSLVAARLSRDEFKTRVDVRIAELKAKRHATLNRAMLIEERTSDDGRLRLIRSYYNNLLDDVFRSEVFCFTGSSLTTFAMQTAEMGPDERERTLMSIANSVRSVDAGAPASAGFQLGTLVVQAPHDQEIASVNFRNPTAPDALISISVNALAPNASPSLLVRWDKNHSLFARIAAGSPTTIRRGKVAMAGMEGEELLSKMNENGRTIMQFGAESRRSQPAFDAPLINVTLDTQPIGRPSTWPPASWTEQQAVGAWDGMIRSLRLRPGSI
jgi:hypothetical protein